MFCFRRTRKLSVRRLFALLVITTVLLFLFFNFNPLDPKSDRDLSESRLARYLNGQPVTGPHVTGMGRNRDTDPTRGKSSEISRSQLQQSRGFPMNFLDDECETCDDHLPGLVFPDLTSHKLVERILGEEKMVLYRHYHGFEPWPQIQLGPSLPGQIPWTMQYLWCKPRERSFGFHHYLGALSLIRHLQPGKVIFHYRAIPRLDHDMYFTWLLELKQSLPNLVLRPLPVDSPPCGSPQLLETMLSLLQQDGGVLMGSNVIISRVPRDIFHTPFWFAFPPNNLTKSSSERDVTRGIVIATRGFTDEEKHKFIAKILTSNSKCVSPETFNTRAPDSNKNSRCVVFEDQPDIYPVTIMYTNSSFGQLSRWLYYGTRSSMHPKTNIGEPIPRISHLIWFSNDRNSPYEMQFYQFLTVLSALYVGGFHHVYIHGNAGFKGAWWDRLAGENVTFVWVEDPEQVFQQSVGHLSHKSDVSRYSILHKYGGAYHDFEAMWTMRVPDWLLQYPCIATSDWVAYGEFPDGINPGVLMAKRNAPWLRYNLAAHRYYVDKNFVWNAILMSYRTYERHPDQLLYYRHLQVMCDFGICHPTWEPGFRRDITDDRPTPPFDWRRDTLVVHVTRPDPETSFRSPAILRTRNDMFAEIGKNILQKSGHLDLLGS